MKRKICMAGMILFSVLFFVSGIMFFRQYRDEKKSDEVFNQLTQLIHEETSPSFVEEDGSAKEFRAEESEAPEIQAQNAFDKYAELYARNTDFVGWIRIDGTNIDYPVMQTKDSPDYYLRRSFEKRYSDYGVPYVAEHCDVDISDNTVIYGHHMNNKTMFSALCDYDSIDFYEEHKKIRFDTLGGFGEYEIVTVFKTVVYTEEGFKFYQFAMANDPTEFDEYISKCKELALYDTGVSAEYGDKLITLSSCEYSQQNSRLVVVAKKISV